MNAPLSSQIALLHRPGTRPSGPGSSNSFSTANRRPNSMSSTLYTAVPACCISWIAARDSSYFRVNFPVRNEKIRICRSGKEKVTKEDESGDNVMQVGVDFDCSMLEKGMRFEDTATHLFELIQVCIAFVRPYPKNVFGRCKRFYRLPILYETLFIR